MTNPSVNVFDIGTLPILDTTQGNGAMEAAGTRLDGYDLTTGPVGGNQFDFPIMTIHHDAHANDELLATNGFGASPTNPDGLRKQESISVEFSGISDVHCKTMLLTTCNVDPIASRIGVGVSQIGAETQLNAASHRSLSHLHFQFVLGRASSAAQPVHF